jgi:hypothetical protein
MRWRYGIFMARVMARVIHPFIFDFNEVVYFKLAESTKNGKVWSQLAKYVTATKCELLMMKLISNENRSI